VAKPGCACFDTFDDLGVIVEAFEAPSRLRGWDQLLDLAPGWRPAGVTR
jgi:hypothetical protein